MKDKRAWLILSAIAIALGLFAGFALTRKDQPQYFTAKVERGDIRNVVDVTGTINAVTTVVHSNRGMSLSGEFWSESL